MKSDFFQTKATVDLKELAGSETFRLTAQLKNLSSERVYIEPLVLDQYQGELIGFSSSGNNPEIGELERQKIELINNLETISKKIFLDNLIVQERKELNDSGVDQFFFRFLSIFNLSTVFVRLYYLFHQNFRQLPDYLKKNTEIRDIGELQIIEKVIQNMGLKMKKMHEVSFKTDKEKLIRCIDKIKELDQSKDKEGPDMRFIPIPPKTEASFHYEIRLPFKISDQTFAYKMSTKVIDENNRLKETISIEKDLHILPSPHAIPIGAFLGGGLGYFFKFTFLGYIPINHISLEIIGILLFSTFISLWFRKLPNKKAKKILPITVDDIWGGLVLGVLVGIFTNRFFQYIEGMIPK